MVMCSWLATVLALSLIGNPACAQAPSAVQRQVEQGLDLCLRFARRQLDDSVQCYGDQVGFRPTDRYRVQRWSDPADPALWVELEADGSRMQCDVRVSPATLASSQAAIEALGNLYTPKGFRRSESQIDLFAAAWLHDEQEGLITLAVTPDAFVIATTP